MRTLQDFKNKLTVGKKFLLQRYFFVDGEFVRDSYIRANVDREVSGLFVDRFSFKSNTLSETFLAFPKQDNYKIVNKNEIELFVEYSKNPNKPATVKHKFCITLIE